MTKIVHLDETLNIYYRVSEDTNELEDIVKIEKDGEEENISDLPDLQNTKMIQWSPDSEHEDEEFEFDIDGFGTEEIKVTNKFKNIIENFEHNNINNNWKGDISTLNADIQNSESYHGDFALKTDNNEPDESIVYDGPNKTPSRGDRWRFYIYLNQSDHLLRFGFFLQNYSDSNNVLNDTDGYQILFNQRSSTPEVELREMINGSQEVINSVDITLPTKEWIEIGVTTRTDDNEILVRGRSAPDFEKQPVQWNEDKELFSLSMNDDKYNSGDIALIQNDSTPTDEIFHDGYIIFETGF